MKVSTHDLRRRTHELKTLQPFYDAVKTFRKTFEVRKNDREFKVGDKLKLMEYSIENGYTGNYVERFIVHIVHGGQFGIEAGYCVLGLNEQN